MQYDFDTPIDRTHTWSIKHDFKKENGKADDILPLWVADMDFRSPDSVVEALKKAVDHGIFGYSRAAGVDDLHARYRVCTLDRSAGFYPEGRCGVDPAAGLPSIQPGDPPQ